MIMPLRFTAIAVVLGIALWNLAPPVRSGDKKGPPKEAVANAEWELKGQLGKIKGAERGQIVPLHSPALDKALPKHFFFAVRFRQFPVARALPEGMKASNIFVVSKEGKEYSVHRLSDAKGLEKYFQKHLPAVKEQD